MTILFGVLQRQQDSRLCEDFRINGKEKIESFRMTGSGWCIGFIKRSHKDPEPIILEKKFL
jgi:hypothetical protein